MAIEFITSFDEISYPLRKSPDIDELIYTIRSRRHLRKVFPAGSQDLTPENPISHRYDLLVHENGAATLRMQAIIENTFVKTDISEVPDKFKFGGMSVNIPTDMGDVAIIEGDVRRQRDYLRGVILHFPGPNPEELLEEIIDPHKP